MITPGNATDGAPLPLKAIRCLARVGHGVCSSPLTSSLNLRLVFSELM